ncbi:MAG: helix-turn-helix domain-containing protein [Anaerolineae bacterium]|nr:helix-turn-helix domain-containing protein [Anaerolineae bacterium]
MDEYLPLTEQLRILFDARQHADGRPYTLAEVSEATGISQATISQMRTGRIKNPQLDTLRTLGRFFNIPLRYFETTSVEECYSLLAEKPSEADPPLNEIAFRASGLSPRSQRDILTIIKWVQAAEKQGGDAGLPPLPGLTEDFSSPDDER